MQHKQHPDSKTPLSAQSPVIGRSNASSCSNNDSNIRSSSNRNSSRPNHTRADRQTAIPAVRIQVRLPQTPRSQSSVRCSPHTTRYSSTHLFPHLDMYSLDSQGVQIPRADPFGLGLEPQNLSSYLPKEPP
jgi:hypothetical protein